MTTLRTKAASVRQNDQLRTRNSVPWLALFFGLVMLPLQAIAAPTMLSFAVTVQDNSFMPTFPNISGLDGATVTFTATFPDGAVWITDGAGGLFAPSSSHSFTITGATVPGTNGTFSDPDGMGLNYLGGAPGSGDIYFIESLATFTGPAFSVQGGSDACVNPTPVLCLNWEFSLDVPAVANQPSIGDLVDPSHFATTFTPFSSLVDSIFALGQSVNSYEIITVVTPVTAVAGGNPEMDMFGGVPLIAIADGDVTPSVPDGTDFGGAEVASTTVSGTFEIRNTGTSDLTLSGGPSFVTISGANSADFSVFFPPTSPVASVGSTIFGINFFATATGVRSATVSISSDDADENPYTFAIRGTGLVFPDMSVAGGVGPTIIADNAITSNVVNGTDFGTADVLTDSVANTFVITNSGAGALNLNGGMPLVVIGGFHPTDFTVTVGPTTPIASGGGMTTFTVTFNPTAAGFRSATVSIANDDPGPDPYNFAISGSGTTTPEMDVAGGAGPTSIADGSAAPNALDGTDFGGVAVGLGAMVSSTFTISNSGSRDLNLAPGMPLVVIGGAHPADFTVTAAPTTPVPAAGGMTSFTIVFDPTAGGQRDATVTIQNNDIDEDPYNFNLRGVGTEPVIEIAGGAGPTLIAIGDPTPSIADGTDFGAAVVPGDTVNSTFVISNTGDRNLSLVSVNIGGSNASEFIVFGAPSSPVAPGASTSITLRFAPTALGPRTATLSIRSNDFDQSPYTFSIQGNGAVGQTDLSISKSDSPDPVTAGSNLTYTVTVTNSGPDASTGSTVTDVLPAGVSFVSSADCTEAAGTVTCAVGPLVNATSQMASFLVAVDAGQTASIVNTASVAADDDDSNAANNSAMSTTTVVASTDLSIAKSSAPDPVTAGTNLTYTITVTNDGPSDSTGGSVTDVLSAGLSFVSSADCSEAAGTVTCAIGALANGANQMVSFIVAVDAGQTTSIMNTATVVANETDSNAGNDSATSTTTVATSTDLLITKTAAPDPVTAGTNLTYTVTVTNDGPSDSTGGSVTDVLPAGVSFVSSADCTEAAGTVTCAIGALVNGANQMVSFIVAVDAGQTTAIMNTATVAANETDPNAVNDSATSTTAVAVSTDLAISKTGAPDPVTAGTNLTYTLTVTNNGPSDSTGGLVTDMLPVGISFDSSTDCTAAAGTVSCAIGALANGANQVVSFVVAVDSAQTAAIVNTATVVANETDPNATNNSATATTAVVASADLSITKDDGVTVAIPGTSVTYAIVVSNSGPSDAPGSTVSDTFPAACTSVAWACVGASGATCTASGSGNISDVVSVPAAGSVTYSAVCSINPAATGSLVNTASVAAAAGVTDPTPANNSATDTDTLTPTADLAISKTDNAITAQVNSAGSYVISASNAGPSDAPGSTVNDVFPANFTPAAWNCVGAGGGVCPASGSGNIGASVNLPAGGSVVFTVAGTYAGTIGIVSNTATVATAATVVDPSAANNGAIDTTEIVSPATLSATKIGIANMTVSGGSLNYVIEISNAGPQNQLDNPGPEMVDILPFGYVYLSATASSGTLSFDAATRTLEWSGPVAIGQTISISINGSIDPAVAGRPLSNQAALRFDADGNGSNEAGALSDDPSQPGPADPTVVGIGELVQVPTLGHLGLLLIGLLLALSGGLLLRQRG